MYLLNISNSIYIYKQWKKLKFKDDFSLKKNVQSLSIIKI